MRALLSTTLQKEILHVSIKLEQYVPAALASQWTGFS